MAFTKFNTDYFYHKNLFDYSSMFVKMAENKQQIEVEVLFPEGNKKYKVVKVIVDTTTDYFKKFKIAVEAGLSGKPTKKPANDDDKQMLCIKESEFNSSIKTPNMFKGVCVINGQRYIAFFPWERVGKTQISQNKKNKNTYGKAFNDAAELATIESLKFKGKFFSIKDTKQKIFEDNPELFVDWKDTFDNTKKHLKKELKKPITSYDIIHDGTSKSNGLAKLISDIAKNIFHRSSKDAYNPADIYITHERNVVKKIENYIKYIQKNVKDENIKKKAINNLLYNLYNNDLYYPVSLKKIEGVGRLKKYNNPKDNVPVYIIKDIIVNCKLDGSSQEIGGVVIKLIDCSGGKQLAEEKTVRIQMRMFGSSAVSSLIQLECTSDGTLSGGRIGKIPKDIIVNVMKKYGEHNIAEILSNYKWFGEGSTSKHYIERLDTRYSNTNSKIDFLYSAYNFIKLNGNKDQLSITFNKSFTKEQFKSVINSTFTNNQNQDKLQKNLCGQLQGMLYLYFLCKHRNNIHDIVTSLFNGAQRLGENNGFFIKVF